MNKKLKVGILLFNEVEVLDFAGPFEVFSLTEKDDEKLFEVITIAETSDVISARNGLKIVPDATFLKHPELDILIVPGGYGADHIEINNPVVLNWIKAQHKKVQLTASICTGAFLLAECNLLDGKKATTHWMDLNILAKAYPKITVVKGVKFVDEGNILTAGGISAGINLSFYIVKSLFGEEIAKFTAKRMEYDIKI